MKENGNINIVLLGKNINDYPCTDRAEEIYIYTKFPDGVADHNVKVHRSRLAENFQNEVYDLFLMEGNELKQSHQIIAMVRVVRGLNILTSEQWKRAIPIIERGLEANKAYVRMLDELSPILERYFNEYSDVNMHFTFMERIHLELWQGRFNNSHWANPNKNPNYK